MIGATSTGRLVIVGAGGFGREVLDIVEAVNADGGTIEFVGYVDDGQPNEEPLRRRSATCLGPSTMLPKLDAVYVIGIGTGRARRSLASAFDAAGVGPATLVHPAATVGGDNRIAAGCILAAGSRVTTNITLGRHVQLHVNSTVGHDTILGDFVSVFPGATISGDVTIEAGVTVGTGANVLPGITVGEDAYIGAGAVVTKDVQARATVVGTPARAVHREYPQRADDRRQSG